jgi:hypothetical protein
MFNRRLKRRIEALESRVSQLECDTVIPYYNTMGWGGGMKLTGVLWLILDKLHVHLKWKEGTPSHFELEE